MLPRSRRSGESLEPRYIFGVMHNATRNYIISKYLCSTDDENAIGTAPRDACSTVGSAAAAGNYDASTAPFTVDGNDSISTDVASYLNDEVEFLEHKPHYSAILTPNSIPPSSAWILFFQ